MNPGIFYRLLFSLVALFLLSISFMGYMLIDEARDVIEKNRLQQAHTLAKSLAEGSLDALASNDYELLERWLQAATPIEDFAYAYLSRENGLIIAHTNPDWVARQSNLSVHVNGAIVRDRVYQGRPVREVVYAVYLGSKHLANAHLAYFLDNQSFYSETVVLRLAILLLLTLVALSIASFFILRWILNPVEKLAGVMQHVSQTQDFNIRVERQRNDETGVLVDSFNTMLEQIQLRDNELVAEKEHAQEAANSAKKYARQVEKTNIDLETEINERIRIEIELQDLNETLEKRVKARTHELEELNQRIGDIARNAGMAEVASGVLHNVGNVLNSVNVSASVIGELLLHSRLPKLPMVIELLDENSHRLAEFLSNDPKGSKIPHFLKLLSEQLEKEQADIHAELDSLSRNIDHIKNVISMQQSYAGNYGVFEDVEMQELIEDALKINLQGMELHHIKIIRDYQPVPVLNLDKHKVLQILINLISNAKYALMDSQTGEKIIYLDLYATDDRVCVEVRDTGMGIAEEDLPHLFEYGFKKRKSGHGFGLHNSALVANILGGIISASSEGPGKGACFKFCIPLGGDSSTHNKKPS